jgi:hypothetical protein
MTLQPRSLSAATTKSDAFANKMTIFRISILSLLLVSTVLVAVIARDFSLHELSIFEDYQYDDVAVMQAGLDVDNVLENHPAMVANLRSAMQGGMPVMVANGVASSTTVRKLALHSVTIPTSPQQELNDDEEPRKFADQQATIEQNAVTRNQESPGQRFLQQSGQPGGVRGSATGLGLGVAQESGLHDVEGDDSGELEEQASRTRLQRDDFAARTHNQAMPTTGSFPHREFAGDQNQVSGLYAYNLFTFAPL